MNTISMWITCFFIILPLVHINCNEMSPPNTDGWVNPDDIFIHTKLISKKVSLEEAPSHMCHGELKSCLEGKAECEKGLEGCKERIKCNSKDCKENTFLNLEQSCKTPTVVHDTKYYMRRFVNLLLKVINRSKKDAEESEVLIPLEVSTDQMAVLQRFGEGKDVSLRLLDETLSDVFVKAPAWYFVDFGAWSTLKTFMNTLMSLTLSSEMWSLVMCILIPSFLFVIILMVTKSFAMSTVSFFLSAFLTSYIITAMRMIKEASLKPCSDETDCSLPSHLGVTSMGILTRMFGETFADVSEHSGSAVVNFFSQINNNFNILEKVWVVPSVITIISVISLVIVMCISGGVLYFPFSLGGVGLHRPTRAQESSSSLTSQIKDGSGGDSAQNLLPPSAPQTNHFTFNFGASQQIDEVRSILQSVTLRRSSNTEEVQDDISSFSGLKPCLEDIKEISESSSAMELMKSSGVDSLSGGDSVCSSSLKATSSNHSKGDLSESQEVFRFTAPTASTLSKNQKEIPLRGGYRSGRPPTKVVILERLRHKSL